MSERLPGSTVPAPRMFVGQGGVLGGTDTEEETLDIRPHARQNVLEVVPEPPVAPSVQQEESEALPKIDWMLPAVPTGKINQASARATQSGMDYRHKLFTVREAAAIFRHSVEWVRKEIRAKRIKARRLGNAYYIPGFEITRLLGGIGQYVEKPRAKNS